LVAKGAIPKYIKNQRLKNISTKGIHKRKIPRIVKSSREKLENDVLKGQNSFAKI